MRQMKPLLEPMHNRIDAAIKENFREPFLEFSNYVRTFRLYYRSRKIIYVVQYNIDIYNFTLLTLSFFLHCSSFEIQHPTTVLRLRSAKLLPHLLGVVGMNLRVEARTVPVALRVVQHRRNRIGHVDNSTCVATDNKQKSVGSFKDQMLQFLIREEGRLVSVVRRGISSACDTILDDICRGTAKEDKKYVSYQYQEA